MSSDEKMKLKPCPMCGREYPFTYISFNCCVLRCECGIELKNACVKVMYKRNELPDNLKDYTYEPTGLVMKQSDGTLVKYPDHGYIGVSALAALYVAGFTEKWNTRTAPPQACT